MPDIPTMNPTSRHEHQLTHRQFIKSSYPEFKKANPDVKVLIREAQGVSPRAFVRLGESRSEGWEREAGRRLARGRH